MSRHEMTDTMTYMGNTTYSPNWQVNNIEPALPVSPPPMPREANEVESLDRLQLTLIWFGSILIAVTIYTQIRGAF